MIKSLCLLSLFFVLLFPLLSLAQDNYFIMGSGQIKLKSSKGSTSTLTYRTEKGYDENALRKINLIYGGNYDDPLARMSLRFLELISNIQSHFGGAAIVIRSGYRSPRSNQGLRNQGKMAAQSSMHIEAAAVDFYIPGVDVLELKEYATQLPCCGVGYYHGKHIHLDTGPKRWWDETNSGTDKKEPQENEKIIVLMQQDIYRNKDPLLFDFARVTSLPVGVKPQVQLEKWEKDQWKSPQTIPLDFSKALASVSAANDSSCVSLQDRRQLKEIALKTTSLSPGRYRMQVSFCNKASEKMPDQIYSDPFEWRNP